MCKVGDIILINQYKQNGRTIGKHSFIVVSDENGKIEGLDYDIVANVMSSFKDPVQKERKLKYEGNFPLVSEDTVTNPHNEKAGYVKTEQLYYFQKDKIDYNVIGYVKKDIMDLILEFIEESNFEFVAITDNL